MGQLKIGERLLDGVREKRANGETSAVRPVAIPCEVKSIKFSGKIDKTIE